MAKDFPAFSDATPLVTKPTAFGMSFETARMFGLRDRGCLGRGPQAQTCPPQILRLLWKKVATATPVGRHILQFRQAVLYGKYCVFVVDMHCRCEIQIRQETREDIE